MLVVNYVRLRTYILVIVIYDDSLNKVGLVKLMLEDFYHAYDSNYLDLSYKLDWY